jgi:shikimate kinase
VKSVNENIIFIGFTSCGKSAAGRQLSLITNREFKDLDDIVEDIYFKEKGENLKCRVIYEVYGENFFRKLESKALKSLKCCETFILSTGGGVVRLEENLKLLKELGKVVYLKTAPDVIYNRMTISKGLPAYLDGNAKELEVAAALLKIEPEYLKIADLIIENSDLSPIETAKKVIDSIKL